MRPRVLPRTRGCRFERVGRRRRRGGQPGIVRVRRRFERPKRRRRRPKEDGSKAHHRRQPRAEVRERLHVVVADVEVRERPRLAVGPRDGERVQRPDPVVSRDESAQLRGAEVDAVEGDDRVVGDVQRAQVSEHGQSLEAREAVAGEVKVSERVAARPEHRIDVHPGQPAAVHAQGAQVGEPADADDLRQRLQPPSVARYLGDFAVGCGGVVPQVHLGEVALAEGWGILIERAARGGFLVGITLSRATPLGLFPLTLLQLLRAALYPFGAVPGRRHRHGDAPLSALGQRPRKAR